MEKRKKRLLTVKEVAGYLRVNQTTIYRLVRKSQIPAFKVGGDWRFSIDNIDQWRLNSNAVRLNSDDAVSPRSSTDAVAMRSDLVRLTLAIGQMVAPLDRSQMRISHIRDVAHAIEDKRDASDQVARLYENQLVPYREHWEDLFEFAPVAFRVANSQGHLVSFNDAYRRLFRSSSKRLRAVVLTDLVHESDVDRFATLNRQLLSGEVESVEFVGKGLTGRGSSILIRSHYWTVRRKRSMKPGYAAALLQRVATPEEAAIGFQRCAEKLSKRRETFLPHR